jgi:hypothetical protein
MQNLTNHRTNKPYIKFHFSQSDSKFPKPVMPAEKYYKDRYERRKEDEKEYGNRDNTLGID